MSSGVGAVGADLCEAIHEYRSVLMGTGTAKGSNPLIDSGFTCPEGVQVSLLKEHIENTATSLVQNELTKDTVQLLLNTSAEQLAEMARWSGEEVVRKLDCSEQISFSGRVEFVVCGAGHQSAIDGVYGLWVGSLGLALSLNAALFFSLFGMQVAGGILIWEGNDVDERGAQNETSSSDDDGMSDEKGNTNL